MSELATSSQPVEETNQPVEETNQPVEETNQPDKEGTVNLRINSVTMKLTPGVVGQILIKLLGTQQIQNTVVEMLMEMKPELRNVLVQGSTNMQESAPTGTKSEIDTDIETIMEQTECSMDVARKLYGDNDGNMVETVLKIHAMKQDGTYEEFSKSVKPELHENEDDIQLILQQTNCTRERAIESYESCNGDIVETIMKITS